MPVTERDTELMRRALALAVRGRGHVSPNPLVGCVITDASGSVIGEGWHERYGEAHAEVNAVRNAESNGHSVEGATAYVTLEPCSHHGKTGPCADMLIAKKIARCVIAMEDPYHEVQGRGIKKLRDAGIEVEVGVLEAEAREIGKFFIKYVTTGMPYVTMKIAMSLDGKVALKSGASKYITSEASRAVVHRMRAEYDAVMVASATVISDDPELTVRLAKGRQPKRIILDASLRVSEHSKAYSDEHRASTIVVVNERILTEKKEKAALLSSQGVTFVPVVTNGEQLDLSTVLQELGKRGIASILIEPGPTLATTIFAQLLFDELVLFYAPTVLGDDARSAFGDLHLRSLAARENLTLVRAEGVGESGDVLLELRLKH
ncbi:MAG: bifunctional diaminohydroxyphosphoribosylaminopyrimidine deaminase/5-amino-6-(5-phosphoribosylamino)uracil reductase RibD [Bacteroidetes bacterium]|nr:bifunctional diaminohydroxyphosphoribosylaminopyrimidine deaminase/5-amino-6-(5-phosphoribosylamino)uracil reductase RibD [Bacteroidota bacterium]